MRKMKIVEKRSFHAVEKNSLRKKSLYLQISQDIKKCLSEQIYYASR
jgi:hypothetical protein